MGEDAMREMLEETGHGVLCLGSNNRGYGFPLSYTYDRDRDRLFLGLTAADGGKKHDFVSATEEVTLCVYRYKDLDSWRSVIVTGTLEAVEESALPQRMNTVFFSHDSGSADGTELATLNDFDRQWYELAIDGLSGRHSG